MRMWELGRVLPPKGQGDEGSEVSEWELRERWEREEEGRVKAGALGVREGMGVREKQPLFLSTASFMASEEEE